jgi:hypothetical protein
MISRLNLNEKAPAGRSGWSLGGLIREVDELERGEFTKPIAYSEFPFGRLLEVLSKLA